MYDMPGLGGTYGAGRNYTDTRNSATIQQELENDPTPWPGQRPSGFLNQQWAKFGPSGRAAAMVGGVAGLMSMLGRRSGPSREEIEQEALARSGMGLADQFGGEMGSMGMGLQNDGRSMLERGRSRYLSSMFDPNVATGQRAQLASDLAQSRRGVGNTVGLIGGPLLGAQFARNASQFTPDFARNSTGITRDQLGRQAQGAQFMVNAGQQDFNQGLGLRNQGFGIQSQGRQQLGGMLGRLDQQRQQRRAQQQAAIGGLFRAAGSASTGGLF